MCRHKYLILLTSLMLIGLLGTASMGQEDGTWTQKADMPTARYIAGSAVVDGKIYVIGGAPVSEGISAVVEEYDPATDTWTGRADMPTARQGLCAAAVDGIIYAIGGWGKASLMLVGLRQWKHTIRQQTNGLRRLICQRTEAYRPSLWWVG